MSCPTPIEESLPGDAAYAVSRQQGATLHITHTLSVDDTAFVLGACHERNVSISTAVEQALVQWASS